MLKYSYTDIYTVEIPNELSLGISILGCPIKCPDCHSSHTWDINCHNEYSRDLTIEELDTIISNNSEVSCILFFGGEWKYSYLTILLNHIKNNYTYKTALYSGNRLEYLKKRLDLTLLDYCKVGEFKKELGGLKNKNTNQRLYILDNGNIKEDITYTFWKTKE